MSRVLQVVVESQNCAPLWWLRDNHLTVFTHYGSIVNQSDIKILIKDMVALEAMLDCCINPLSVCDLLGSEGINLLLFGMIGKHMV